MSSFEFGSAFRPIAPPEPTHDERQHNEIVDALLGIQMAQEAMTQVLVAMAEQDRVAPVIEAAEGADLSPLLEALSQPHPVPPSPEATAEALARRLPDYGPTLNAVAKGLAASANNLERLNKKVTGLSVMPSGGSSGHVIVDSGQVDIAGGMTDATGAQIRDRIGDATTTPQSNSVNDRLRLLQAKDYATEATLGTRSTEATLLQVRDYLDTVETLLAARATEATLGTRAADATVAEVRDRLPAALHADGGINVHLVNVPPEFEEFTVLASGARSVGFNGDAFINPRHRGLRLYLNTTAASGTLPTLDVKLQTQDPVSGAWADMPSATFAQQSASGLAVLVIYPGINQGTMGSVARVSNVMSRRWRLVHTIGGTAPSFTYSVAGLYLP